MGVKKLRRIAEAAERYIEKHVELTGPGGPPETPIQRSKGSSRTPASEAMHRFMDANIPAAKQLGWRIEAMRRCRAEVRGVAFADLFLELYSNPGAIRNWRAEATGEDRDKMASFREMCQRIAISVLASNPDAEVYVTTNPKDEPASTPKEAAYRDRRIDTRDTYREIVKELEGVKRETGKDGWDAYWELHVRVKDDPKRGWSVAKIRHALTQVNKERGAA